MKVTTKVYRFQIFPKECLDLRLTLNGYEIDFCPDLTMDLTLENIGEVNVNNIELGLYLGDPRQEVPV